jgi:hypothetical protein
MIDFSFSVTAINIGNVTDVSNYTNNDTTDI